MKIISLLVVLILSGCVGTTVRDSEGKKSPPIPDFTADVVTKVNHIQVDVPSWVPKRHYGTAAACIDEYVTHFEKLSKQEVPKTLRVKIVEGNNIADHYSGYYWYKLLAIADYKVYVKYRIIAIIWAGAGHKPAAVGPFPSLIHELVHDYQQRNGEEISHNWKGDQQKWANTRPRFTCDIFK